MRPLIVRGARTMLIDAGLGDKENAKFHEHLRRRSRAPPRSRAGRGRRSRRRTSTSCSRRHLHFDHAGGFTVRDATAGSGRAFPRAQYVVRRGEWEDATHPHERNRASYLADNYVPLAEAGVLQLVDDDADDHAGRAVRRTGGHTLHHQMVMIESGGQTAAFVADLIPTTAHLPDAVDHGLRPLSDGHAGGEAAVRAAKRSNARRWCSSSTTRRSPPATSAKQNGKRRASANQRDHDADDARRSASSAAAACTTWRS